MALGDALREFFQKQVPPDGCVLELGAGYGHFINHIRCRRRIALDIGPACLSFWSPMSKASGRGLPTSAHRSHSRRLRVRQ